MFIFMYIFIFSDHDQKSTYLEPISYLEAMSYVARFRKYVTSQVFVAAAYARFGGGAGGVPFKGPAKFQNK